MAKRASLALLFALSAGCGARSELIVPGLDGGAASTNFPPGCQWQLGDRVRIAEDVERAVAPTPTVAAPPALASNHVLFAWNSLSLIPGARTARYATHTLALAFNGQPLAPARAVFDSEEPHNLLGLLTNMSLVRTASGFALLTWRGGTGCSAVRVDDRGAFVSITGAFSAGNYCDDLDSLDDGGLRVWVGGRPIGTGRFPTLHTVEWMDIARDGSLGPATRGAFDVIARATYGDRTGVALVTEPTQLTARMVNSAGRFEGDAIALQPLPNNAPIEQSRMRVISDGALALWGAGPSVNVARFDRRRALQERWALELGGGGATVASASADVRAGLLFVTWTTSAHESFARVFDRSGTALSERLALRDGAALTRTQIVATPDGALVVGTSGDGSSWESFAAPLHCAR